MERVQDGGLESKSATAYCEYTRWQYFSRKKHKDVKVIIIIYWEPIFPRRLCRDI